MKDLRIIWAANATYSVGAGHVRRLLEIRKNLEGDIDHFFFGKLDIPWLIELTQNYWTYIHSSANKSVRANVVVLDSYDPIFCEQVKSYFPQAALIQIADRNCPLLSDSNVIYLDTLIGENHILDKKNIIAFGTKFMPLRRFDLVKKEFIPIAENVIVTVGGSSNLNMNLLLEKLLLEKYKDVDFWITELDSISRKFPNNFHFFSPGEEFDKVAANCDSAISACGTTIWDLISNELLSGVFPLVPNQLYNFNFVVSERLAISLMPGIESINTASVDIQENSLDTLIFDTSVRQSIWKNLQGEYDFLGAIRTSQLIKSFL